MERAFYQSSLNLSVSNLLKLCNHYYIGNHADGLGAFEAMSIEKVTEVVQITRKTEVEALKRQIENTKTELAQLDAALASFYKSGSTVLETCSKRKVSQTQNQYCEPNAPSVRDQLDDATGTIQSF
ncbi:hypothetical protein HDU77_011263 [Chytriomyces hyalinus]|nr:hypothetical protein HDU77_011263 [Chytriomyces hyalinus]